MMKKNVFVLLVCFMVPLLVHGQTSVKGRVVDAKTNEPVVGASVILKGNGTGTVTRLDGNFSFKTKEEGLKKIVINLLGYISAEKEIEIKGETVDMGVIALEDGSVGLQEVSVIASVAIDRKTPVAVSTIKQSFIEEKLGNDEFPEILKQTPGIYATKQGGAFGDSRVNVRGFESKNVAVMINGIPINDMEGSTVYWSNWAGLADVTRSMQVQRGLGASKMAMASVGGTINILTNTTDAVKGGNVFATVGNDNMTKYGFTLSTGLSKNNWASTVSLSKNTGNGYVDATQYASYSYFLNISKKINAKHTLAFTVFGAPQWHNQRSAKLAVSTYEKYNGTRYNDSWGYKDGQVLNYKKNFYHKPQAILNHFWDVSENTRVSTALYASTGTGGGTSAASSITDRTNDGLIDFDKIVAKNIALGNQGSSNFIRSANNNHVWYGLLSTIQHKINNLTLSGGIDYRDYVGRHNYTLTDLLGGQFYAEKFAAGAGDVNNLNKIVRTGDKYGYDYAGKVKWYGVFGQAEYSMDKLTVFASGSLSDKWYQRVDYYNYFSDENIAKINNDAVLRSQYIASLGQVNFDRAMKGQKSKVADMIGFSVKGGANYNLTETQNVFINTGYFQRQPDMGSIYLSYNNKNKDAKNEKVFSFELGYGFRNRNFNANVNLYNTAWKDKSFTQTLTDSKTGVVSYANVLGVSALHQGIELEFVATPLKDLKINGMASIGNWKWKNNVDSVRYYDASYNLTKTQAGLFIKDVHVGNSAQTVLGIGVDYYLMKGLGIGANYTYFDRLYANFDPLKRSTQMGDAWKMPSYGLLDMNLKYDFLMGGMNSSFYVNAHNVLNTKYFADGDDTDVSTAAGKAGAYVWYGLGTTWTVGLKVKF